MLLSITCTGCHILRLECKGEAKFTVKKPGSRSTEIPIAVYTDLKAPGCKSKCLHNPQCKAINFKNGHAKICQLLKKSRTNVFDNVTLSDSPDWEYQTTNYSSRLVSINFDTLITA